MNKSCASFVSAVHFHKQAFSGATVLIRDGEKQCGISRRRCATFARVGAIVSVSGRHSGERAATTEGDGSRRRCEIRAEPGRDETPDETQFPLLETAGQREIKCSVVQEESRG